MKILQSYLKEIHDVSDIILDNYASLWKEYHVSKKHVMKVPGQIERHFYFVISGVQKSYYLYLETITESRFLRISYEQHHTFMTEHREIETLYRKITEIFLNGVIQRQHEIMALSMEDRFTIFVNRSAHLLQTIPQKDIASYLNINPTNFSKLINRIRIQDLGLNQDL